MRIPFGSHEPPPDSDLIGVIRQVRRRWRMKLALRGAATVAALMVAVFLAAALGLESSRFAPGLILTFRVLLPLDNGRMFFRRDSSLVFEHRLEPLQARDDRLEQPFHAKRVIVNPPKINIRGDLAIS